MFTYFVWQQPKVTFPLDQKNAAKVEDEFYARYGALSISARVRRAWQAFVQKEKSNCEVMHRAVKT